MSERKMSRRGFLKASALTAVGVAGASLLSGCATSQKSISYDQEYDVVVVGAGGAGIAAAAEAARANAKVLICEKSGIAGGTTNYSGGVMQAAGTSYQKSLTSYTDDTTAKHAELWIKAGESWIDEDLVNDLAKGAPDNIEWLADMGLKWTSIYGHSHIPYVADDITADRIHVYEGGGQSGQGTVMIQAMLSAAQEAGATIEYEMAVISLIQDDDKNIVGVVAEQNGKQINIKAAKGVILACASIDHNEALAKDLNPQHYLDLQNQACLSAVTNTGDGIIMGMSVGGALSGMGGCIDFCGKTGNATDNRVPTMPLIFVNGRGQRFVCEDATYSYQYRAIFQQEKQHDAPTYMIFGSNSINEPGSAWTQQSLEADVTDGVVLHGDTVAELAQVIAVEAQVLQATIAQWNSNASTGTDTLYQRRTGIKALEAPFYAYKNAAMNLGSIGGLKINTDCQVLDTSGTVIPGLYAAGLNAGGWMGTYYPGSGTAISGIVHQGRKAGNHAANRS